MVKLVSTDVKELESYKSTLRRITSVVTPRISNTDVLSVKVILEATENTNDKIFECSIVSSALYNSFSWAWVTPR